MILNRISVRFPNVFSLSNGVTQLMLQQLESVMRIQRVISDCFSTPSAVHLLDLTIGTTDLGHLLFTTAISNRLDSAQRSACHQ